MDPAVIAILVALIGPIATYLVAVRQLSGKIKTSDASELWEESRSIREWSTGRIKDLTEQIRRLEARLDEVEMLNHALMEENIHLKELLEKERDISARLKAGGTANDADNS